MEKLSLDLEKKLDRVIKNPKKSFWWIKLVHASGHWWQNINHGNSKAQLFFDVNSFFELFELDSQQDWDKFVKVVWKKKIHHDNSVLVLENQETRHAERNKENVLKNLRSLLLDFLQEDKDRIETKVPKKEKEKRLQNKKQRWEIKKNREKPSL